MKMLKSSSPTRWAFLLRLRRARARCRQQRVALQLAQHTAAAATAAQHAAAAATAAQHAAVAAARQASGDAGELRTETGEQ